MSPPVWLAFILAAILISLSPGAISCLASGVRYGYRRSLANIAGMQLGHALQLVVVGAGLGALLAARTLDFDLVKTFGVAYLCHLGWQQFRVAATPVEICSQSRSAGTSRALITLGFLVIASNPKATVFLLAVLPQFIDAQALQLPQYLICMATLSVMDLVIMSG